MPSTRSIPAYAQKLGVNLDDLLISQPDTGEQALEIVDMLVRSNAVDMVVVDSVAALTPRAEIEGEMGDMQLGLQARLMSQALRKLTGNIKRSNCMVIFINQLRMKIGMMMPGQNPETTTGGNALKFYASVRLDIRRIGSVKKGDEIIGNETQIKVVKNKMAPPFKQVITEILYGEGISREGELIDMGVDSKLVEKSGAWYSCDRRAHRPGQGKRPPVPQGQPEDGRSRSKPSCARSWRRPGRREGAAGRRGRGSLSRPGRAEKGTTAEPTAYQRALGLLVRREHSRKELTRKLSSGAKDDADEIAAGAGSPVPSGLPERRPLCRVPWPVAGRRRGLRPDAHPRRTGHARPGRATTSRTALEACERRLGGHAPRDLVAAALRRKDHRRPGPAAQGRRLPAAPRLRAETARLRRTMPATGARTR